MIGKMRFLLYNIRYAAGIGRHFHFPFPYCGYFKKTEIHLKSILRFMKSLNPDIVGLIEVDCGSYRANRKNQAVDAARELKLDSIYRTKYASTSLLHKLPLLNKQGNAILTDRQIIASRFHYFDVGVKRLVIELELRRLSIFLVHLSLNYRDRQRQLDGLKRMLAQVEKPVLVAGDFNSLRGDYELRNFMDATGLKNANRSGRPSYPSRYPVSQLDYIFHCDAIRVMDFRIPLVKFSDHAPLICDFEIIARADRDR